ncbi:U-Kazal-Dg21.2-like isoform X1 [Episyrphus balteatus]|uniref:U-Kazal-Dg21.2-like isoform X1 n=1 Tax=Episyrphus balteatus TaxID=286459 RepID=UPI0024855AAB|nr:U-Kazal-Dg21.2-like isoform X1 [Episyrphus balteatus]
MKFPLICLLILLGTIYKSQARTPKLCNIKYFCSLEEKPVWTTTTGVFCEVFLNECLMLSENCNRVNQNRPGDTFNQGYSEGIPKYMIFMIDFSEAKIITKSKCQSLCRSLVCPAVYDPICGIYNGVRRTFANGCEMSRYICSTGQTFRWHAPGRCSRKPVD